MKKFSLMSVVCGLAAYASATSFVYFSSQGPDSYADGTTVLDGEVYALVWAATGSEFAGFNADGTLVNSDTTQNQLVSAAGCAKDGCCPPLVYILDNDQASLVSTGTFSIYLLDTRVTSADGTTTVAGVSDEGTLTSVNAASTATASVETGSTTATANVAAVSSSSATATAVPTDTPNPVISAVKVSGGKVYVTVTDTVPYLQYGVSAGSTPSNLSETDLVDGINGVSGSPITIIVNDPDANRFFKVIRK